MDGLNGGLTRALGPVYRGVAKLSTKEGTRGDTQRLPAPDHQRENAGDQPVSPATRSLTESTMRDGR